MEIPWEAVSVIGEALDAVVAHGLPQLELQRLLAAAHQGDSRGEFVCEAYASALRGTMVDTRKEAKIMVTRLCNAGIIRDHQRADAEQRLVKCMNHWQGSGVQAREVQMERTSPNKALSTRHAAVDLIVVTGDSGYQRVAQGAKCILTKCCEMTRTFFCRLFRVIQGPSR